MSDAGKLPPLLPESQRTPVPVAPLSHTTIVSPEKPFYRLHPLSGGLTILIDNVFFGAEAITLEMDWPIISVFAFAVTFTGVYLTQRRLDHDSRMASLVKAFIAGFLAGIPTSISGTIFGTLILFASGISSLKSKFGLK